MLFDAHLAVECTNYIAVYCNVKVVESADDQLVSHAYNIIMLYLYAEEQRHEIVRYYVQDEREVAAAQIHDQIEQEMILK